MCMYIVLEGCAVLCYFMHVFLEIWGIDLVLLIFFWETFNMTLFTFNSQCTCKRNKISVRQPNSLSEFNIHTIHTLLSTGTDFRYQLTQFTVMSLFIMSFFCLLHRVWNTYTPKASLMALLTQI